MADVLVDTDVFVDHLRGIAKLQVGNDRIHYSVITRCELFAGKDAEALLGRLLDPFNELPVDRAVAERAGRLRRRHPLRTPDALIAATALEHQLTLVTRNVRDFREISALTVRLPQR